VFNCRRDAVAVGGVLRPTVPRGFPEKMTASAGRKTSTGGRSLPVLQSKRINAMGQRSLDRSYVFGARPFWPRPNVVRNSLSFIKLIEASTFHAGTVEESKTLFRNPFDRAFSHCFCPVFQNVCNFQYVKHSCKSSYLQLHCNRRS
jgi:hypothetical protein